MFFVIVCTYRPHLGFLREQLESIAAQTDGDFRCLVQDDASPPEWSEAIRALCAFDPRFEFRRNFARLGVFHNFEQALHQVPPEAEYVCYCDQDDRWKPEKLARQRQVLADPGIALCHTDLELIDAEGTLLHPSCFEFEGRNVEEYSLPQLITRNCVTGCTLAFRAELLPRILPFPRQGRTPRYHHDLWTALIATQAGRIVAIREPLVSYRQHGANVLGAAGGSTGTRPLLDLLGRVAKAPWPHLRGFEDEWTLRRVWMERLIDRAPPSPRPEARLDVLLDWTQRKSGSVHLLRFAASHLRERDPLAPVAPLVFLGKLYNGYARARAGLRQQRRLPQRLLTRALDRLDPIAPLVPTPAPETAASDEDTALPIELSETAAPAINLVLPRLPSETDPASETVKRLARALGRRGRSLRFITTSEPPRPEAIERTRELLPEVRHLEFVDGSVPALGPAAGASSAASDPLLPTAAASARDRFVVADWGGARRVLTTLRADARFRCRGFVQLAAGSGGGKGPATGVEVLLAGAARPAESVEAMADQLLAEPEEAHA